MSHPKVTPLAHPGHWAVEGTENWVSRCFDGFTVVTPKGAPVLFANTLEEAAALALAAPTSTYDPSEDALADEWVEREGSTDRAVDSSFQAAFDHGVAGHEGEVEDCEQGCNDDEPLESPEETIQGLADTYGQGTRLAVLPFALWEAVKAALTPEQHAALGAQHPDALVTPITVGDAL